MRCPKCGYTSFESYDSCRKCTADLTEFKQSHGITAMILPPSLRAEMAAGLGVETTKQAASPDTNNDMFSFDLPTEQQPAAAQTAPASPFSFDDAPATSSAAAPAASAPDPFASLMTESAQPAAAPPQGPAQGFELNSFSWDDTPAPGTAGSAAAADGKKAEDDDFNSLFGDLSDSDKK